MDKSIKIVLDAGHGGKDSGAIGFGLMEKDITLDLCKRIEKKIKATYENVEILMTRKDDTYPTLQERTNLANKWGADIFVSIHINSASGTASRGFESHIFTTADSKTKAFQNVMQKEILYAIRNNAIADRGKHQSNFHVLRESHMTAILTENLFISNSADNKLLKSNSFREQLANGHVLGLEKFLGLQKINIPPPITKPVNDGLHQVVVGTFTNRENAEKFLNDLKIQGLDGYIQKK